MSLLARKTRHLRRLVLETIKRSGFGHLATSFSCAELICALFYGGVLRFDPAEPRWPGRDRFLLSKGHAAAMLHCALADLGFFPMEELWSTAGENGRLGVHLSPGLPGIEATAGSLGQGLGLGCGLALAARRRGEEHLVYVLMGDAEMQEGSVWEALMFAAHHRLNNLVAIVDRNRMGCAGPTENILGLEPLGDKLAAFGWRVRTIDGHDVDALAAELARPRSRSLAEPSIYIAETIKGRGLPWLEKDPMCHFYHPQGEELARAMAALEEN